MGRILDSQTNYSVDTKPKGRILASMQTQAPITTTQVATTEPITPTVTPKKNTFLSTVKSFFGFTSPVSGFIPKNAEESIQQNIIQPVLDRIINTETGKKSITAYEKGTRGSTTLYATPKAYIQTFKDIATGNGKLSNYGDLFESNFNEAIDEWEKGGEDPSMSWPKKISRSVLESAPQSAIGVLLNMVPVFGKGLSISHFATISAAEQINERGEVNSLGNIGVDVIGDQMLGGTIEGLFKKPATELIKTGFKEIVKQAGRGFIVEGTTEPSQTFLKYANDYRNAKNSEDRLAIIKKTKEYVKNGGVLLEFLVGGISGAGIGGIASLASQSQINPNIPKPKIGITEDDDKEYTPEQNKIREAFREDIKQDLTDTGFNKPYVARQISNETGIDNAITTLMVDEIAETIKPTTGPELDSDTIIKQALNEAGTTLEETKPEETIVEQPKLKISKEEPLITEARKYKSAEEFVKAQVLSKNDFLNKTKGQFNSIRDINGYKIRARMYDNNPWQLVDDTTEIGDGESFRVAESIKEFKTREELWKYIKDNNQSQLEEIWNKAHEGEAKMKISDEPDKFGLTPSMKDNIVKILDDYIETGGKDIELQKDAGLIAEELGLGEYKTYGALTNKLRDILEKSDQYYKGLDTLTTKEDNKIYGKRYNRGVDEGVQYNEGGTKRGDIARERIYSLEAKQGGEFSISRRQTKGYTEPTNIQLPKKKEPGEIKKIITDFLPEAKPETINEIVKFYNLSSKFNKKLTIQRTNTLNGREDFIAGMDPHDIEFILSLKDSDMANIKPSDIRHEIGHAYWHSIGSELRKQQWSYIKQDYNNRKELYDTFQYKNDYWVEFIKNIKYWVMDANKQLSSSQVTNIFKDIGLIDQNNKVILPEDVIEASFNFEETNKKLNTYLTENNLNTSHMTEEYNNLMADEINSFFFENVDMLEDSKIPEVKQYAEDIKEYNIEFKKEGTDFEFGGTRFKLKESTNLTSDDILRKHADIELKRDITITDVYGNKAVLKQGEGITPYEMKGNKYILQDGEAYLVSKSQAENVMNNSKSGEAKPFAPELKQTEETVKGYIDFKNIPLDKLTIEKTKYSQSQDGAIVKYNGKPIVGEMEWRKNETEEDVKKEAIRMAVEHRFGKQETKYSQYTLPGGENYKEILIKAPQKNQRVIDIEKRLNKINEDIASGKLKKEPQEYYDLLQEVKIPQNNPQFKSSHWDEPNVISHIRMNERTYDGKKVAFMEELQSDWAREARKDLPKRTIKEIGKRFAVLDENRNVISSFDTKAEAEGLLNNRNVPTTPLLKNWQELSIKRALQEAVNTNAKYFAWITGEQTSARYNLATYVQDVLWSKSNALNNEKVVTLTPKQGKKITMYLNEDGTIRSGGQSDWKGKKLDEVLGKGLADKIMADESGTLSGDGLSFGGEWAKNLYDKQVKAIVENLTGQKVEMLDMGLPVNKEEGNNLGWRLIGKGERGSALMLDEPGAYNQMKIGEEISRSDATDWVVTDILGDNKFKAIKKDSLEDIDAYAILPKEEASRFNILWGRNQTTLTKEEKIELNDLFAKYDKAKQDPRKLKKLIAETFDISQKTSQQMGIELTPSVKQIVKGEAPQLAKPSGKLPFAEQAYAPVMFSLRKPEPMVLPLNEKLTDRVVKEIYTDIQDQIKPVSGQYSFKTKEEVIEFIDSNKGREFQSSVVNAPFEINDITKQHLYGKDRPQADYDRRTKLFGPGLEIAESKGVLVGVDAITDKEKGITYYNVIGTDTNIPNTIIKVTLSEENKNGKAYFTVSEISGGAPVPATPSSGRRPGRLTTSESITESITPSEKESQVRFSLRKPTLEELKKNLAQTQKALDKAVANPEVYGQNSIVTLNQKVADLRKQIIEAKYPKVDTGDKITDAKTVLEDIEKKLGVSSVVNSLKEKQSLIELSKEVLDQSPMKELEPYVADAGAYKGKLPEVTGKTKEELKKNSDFKGVKNEKTFQFAQKGDSISKEIVSEYGMDIDSNEVRAEFEDYKVRKESFKKEEKKLKQEAIRFGKTDTFQILGKDKSLISEITETRGVPLPLKEIMDQVREEKKARREEVLNHPARPLMKYVDKKTNKLPSVGSNTAFGKSSEQILKDLGFDDVKQANRDIQDYITKRDEFVNPISRLRMQERAAKFLRDKVKIMEEVERKVRDEAKDRKSKIEAIRDFFYMTNTEVKEVIGDVDYRLVSDKQFEEILKNLEEKSIEIAEHQVAVAEVEWTIAQKELHRVENLMELMGYPKNLSELSIEQLNNLNDTLSKFQHGDVFLGVREMETLMKNAKLNVQTQREILQEVIGKRTNVPIEEINKITATQFDKFRSAVSLARQNPFYEIMVNDAYALKIEASIRYQEIENKTNELVKKARESRRRTLIQRLVPTDDMIIAYLEEGDLATKQAIAKDMSKAELELAHYIQDKYIEMRDYLMSLDQLEKYRKDYVTHRPRGFFEAWLRDGATKSPKQFIVQFAKAFKETVFDVHKVDSAAFNITSEKGKEILPLEKFFKYSMRRSGQLIPTRNIAKAFLGYVNTFEVKKGLDKYIPRMEAVARALTPQETTEGGLIKDTTLENFVAQWINTQKGRPLALKFINPGDILDTLLRAGVAFTRTLDLALRIPAQVMSLVGEESATWINIGNKRYLLGQYRAKTAQGKKIAKKYEGMVGKSFWDKMKDDSKTFENKLGETLFAFYGIAAKKANVHHLLGSITEQEFKSGEISTERLGEIKQEMTKWRADDVLSSVMGKTSIGQIFREHKSWAIPIFNQTLSNLQDIKNMVASGEYKTAAKSKQFGELFRATMLTLILVLTLSKWYRDLKYKRDRSLIEEVQYRAMNDALSFMSALSPKTLFVTPRLMAWIDDLSNAISTVIGAMSTGEKTAEGKTPGLAQLKKSFTPKLFSEMLKDTEQDKVMASISKTTSTAQKQIEGIKKEIVEPAQLAWEKVKELGVGTEEADNVVNELSDDEYEAYKLIKKADTDYWVEISKKVTPTVQEAYKIGFGTEEANALIEDMSDDEYAMYKKVKQVLYSKEPTIVEKSTWDNQTFIEHIVNIAKGWATDPIVAFDNLIHGDWKIVKTKNGAIIVERMPLDASQKIKEEAAKNNANYKLDHIINLSIGGTNRKSNLNIISTEDWEANTQVEIYLSDALGNKEIDGDKAREYIIRYKAGKGQIKEGELFDEYNKKYNGKPISFEEIKNEIEER